MAGLTGIYLKRRIDINVEQLNYQMTKSIAYENWYIINNIVEKKGAFGRASLGVLNPGSQPIFNDKKTIWIIMEGEIFDYDKLKIDLVKKGYDFKWLSPKGELYNCLKRPLDSSKTFQGQ